MIGGGCGCFAIRYARYGNSVVAMTTQAGLQYRKLVQLMLQLSLALLRRKLLKPSNDAPSCVTQGLDPRVRLSRKRMDCRVKLGNDVNFCDAVVLFIMRCDILAHYSQGMMVVAEEVFRSRCLMRTVSERHRDARPAPASGGGRAVGFPSRSSCGTRFSQGTGGGQR
jgi:hypothetical protein